MLTSDIDSIKAKYGIVGHDQRLYRALDTALQVSRTDLSVLIQGESGVGKEVIPRIIHDHSPRKQKKYIAINCGSIPEGTIDSELFGHEKGAFTGAIGEHEGYFGAANGGTLFLDEVGELPLSTQARLLRVLETGEYIRVGSNQPRKTDVRIVAATNVNLQRAIRDGKFREDLYFRLCTISIKLPPLRDRNEDILTLFKKFALETADKYNIPQSIRLSREAEQVVLTYKWPGNIRQLRNVAEQLSILHSMDHIITPEILAEYGILPGSDGTDMATLSGEVHSDSFEYTKERTLIFALINQLNNEVKALKAHLGISSANTDDQAAQTRNFALPSAGDTGTDSPVTITKQAASVYSPNTMPQPPLTPDVVHKKTVESIPAAEPDYIDEVPIIDERSETKDLNLENMERKFIQEALERNRYRRKLAALDLGISERTLYRKIKDYGLEENLGDKKSYM